MAQQWIAQVAMQFLQLKMTGLDDAAGEAATRESRAAGRNREGLRLWSFVSSGNLFDL